MELLISSPILAVSLTGGFSIIILIAFFIIYSFFVSGILFLSDFLSLFVKIPKSIKNNLELSEEIKSLKTAIFRKNISNKITSFLGKFAIAFGLYFLLIGIIALCFVVNPGATTLFFFVGIAFTLFFGIIGLFF